MKKISNSFVKNMLVPLIEENVQVVVKLSIIDVCNQKFRKSTTCVLQDRILRIY